MLSLALALWFGLGQQGQWRSHPRPAVCCKPACDCGCASGKECSCLKARAGK